MQSLRSDQPDASIAPSAIPSHVAARAIVVPAFGAATLCMLPILGALVSPSHDDVFHLVGPASALFVPALFNLFLLTFVLAAILYAARPFHRLGILIWSGCFFFMPWVLLKSLTTLYQWPMPHRVSLGLFAASFVCVLIAIMLWRPSRAPAYARGRHVGTVALGFAAIFGLILTLQTCWFGWQARHLNDPAAGAASAFDSRTPAPATPAHPLLLWVVFDELSHDQVFDSRFPDLSLPNIDAFAAQSTVFTRVAPAGNYTEMVLPALMSPTRGDTIRASADGRAFALRAPQDSSTPDAWNNFDQHATVFAEAQSLGYRPAVVGWYNPYCRILAAVLTRCFWTNQSELSAMFPARTIHENLFHPAARLLADIPRFFFPHRFHTVDPAGESHLHIDDYTELRRAADATLADPTLDFVFLHLPIPHPNGIYDRRRHTLTTGPSSYVDNIALVDAYLGHLRQLLEQQHQWDTATVLIMGDHSWRTDLLWSHDPAWSAEEQRASHGATFDDRPFYALKLPHQAAPSTIDRQYAATNTQHLLEALLRHEITTPQQLNLWIQMAR